MEQYVAMPVCSFWVWTLVLDSLLLFLTLIVEF